MKEATQEEQVPRGDLGIVPKTYPIHGPKSVPRVDYERIFVVNDKSALLGEYVLKDDCPLEFSDLRRAIPMSGMRHLVSFFQGEFAFTPFRVDDLWFVVLTRGVPRIEDRASIGTLLAAARVHIVPNLEPALAARDQLLRDREQEIAERESLMMAREQRAHQVDAELQILTAKFKERDADLRVREAKLIALRDYAVQMQRSFVQPPLGIVAPAEEGKAKPSAEETRSS